MNWEEIMENLPELPIKFSINLAKMEGTLSIGINGEKEIVGKYNELPPPYKIYLDALLPETFDVLTYIDCDNVVGGVTDKNKVVNNFLMRWRCWDGEILSLHFGTIAEVGSDTVEEIPHEFYLTRAKHAHVIVKAIYNKQ